jgi:hypothetical protein
MPVSDRDAARAPEAEAPDGRHAPATAARTVPAAQLAARIGNRAFSALVAQQTVARWPDDDGLGGGVAIGGDRLRGGMGMSGSTESLHAAIYGDSSLAHAPGPNVDVRFEQDAVRVAALGDAELATELGTYGEDSLRRLDDGAQRALGAGDARLRAAIRTRLLALGVSAARAGTGMRYGTVSHRVGTIVHGNVATATPFEYPIELWFQPDTTKVDADEIAWIQTVRNVNPTTGANKSPFGTNRMTTDFTKVDRLTGRQQGWYGMSDAQAGGGTLTVWTKGGTATHAYMTDTPSFGDGDRDFHFESAAVARKGPDVGKVYAIVTWGFTVDAALHVTAKPTRVFNKETVGFGDAVTRWNEQAHLTTVADRNAPAQVDLPALR